MPTGTVLLDFGAFPGGSDASVAVTGQASILVSSLVEAWIFPADTADHLTDEHIVEEIDVYACRIVAGVGFTIVGVSRNSVEVDDSAPKGIPSNKNSPTVYGKWNVAWAWV